MQQVTGGSRNHSLLSGRFIAALTARVASERWAVLPADLAVKIADSVRYPDVMVEPAGLDGQALSSAQPVLLVEILSPSSVLRDLKTKLAEYTSLPSLEAYIVASQDEPIVWLWQRTGDAARSFPSDPVEVSGRQAILTIDRLGVAVPLADLYLGIGRAL